MRNRTVAWFLAWMLVLGTGFAQELPNSGAFVRNVVLEAARPLSLEAALRLIAQAAGVDLLVGSVPSVDVRGRISGPFRQVLDTLVNVYGGGQVGYRLVGNTVIVGPKTSLPGPESPARPTAPSLRYLGFASSQGKAVGAVELLGKVYLVAVGDLLPGTDLRVVGLSPLQLEVASGNQRYRYPLGGSTEEVGR